MKVYLAGKISEGDEWRTAFIGHPYDWPRGVADNALDEAWPVWKNAIAPGYDYTGPYFTAAGKSGGHFGSDPNSHSLVPDQIQPHNWQPVQNMIFGKCLQAIDASDTVYAWVESLDAFGTLFELGYAKAKGKRVWIAIPEQADLSDLWFAQESADILTWANTALEGFRKCTQVHTQNTVLSGGFATPGSRGYVYLIRMGEVYKIGRTTDLDRRLLQFRPVLPYPPELIVALPTPDPVTLESALHQRFAHLRLEGEWFKLGSVEVRQIVDLDFLTLADKSPYRDGGQYERRTIRPVFGGSVEGGSEHGAD